jgi:hypothetical protein
MCKKLSAVLYSVLFLLLLCISGCYVAAVTWGKSLPPKNIVCDKSWEVTIDIVVNPPQLIDKHSERCRDVIVHIRNSADSNFIAVPMVLDSMNLDRGEFYWKADIKPVSCDSNIEYVEYYIDYSIVEFGHYSKYHRIGFYKVPVSRK